MASGRAGPAIDVTISRLSATNTSELPEGENTGLLAPAVPDSKTRLEVAGCAHVQVRDAIGDAGKHHGPSIRRQRDRRTIGCLDGYASRRHYDESPRHLWFLTVHLGEADGRKSSKRCEERGGAQQADAPSIFRPRRRGVVRELAGNVVSNRDSRLADVAQTIRRSGSRQRAIAADDGAFRPAGPGHGMSAQHGRERSGRLAVEQPRAGEHLEQHDAERPDVGALVASARAPARDSCRPRCRG